MLSIKLNSLRRFLWKLNICAVFVKTKWKSVKSYGGHGKIDIKLEVDQNVFTQLNVWTLAILLVSLVKIVPIYDVSQDSNSLAVENRNVTVIQEISNSGDNNVKKKVPLLRWSFPSIICVFYFGGSGTHTCLTLSKHPTVFLKILTPNRKNTHWII